MAVTLTVKTRSGAIQDISVDSLVAVDGAPYGGVTIDTIKDSMVHLAGRVQALESVLSSRFSESHDEE